MSTPARHLSLRRESNRNVVCQVWSDARASADAVDVDEQIFSAHVALTRERPEILGEYARIRHERECAP